MHVLGDKSQEFEVFTRPLIFFLPQEDKLGNDLCQVKCETAWPSDFPVTSPLHDLIGQSQL